MNSESKRLITDNYRELLARHGDGSAAIQWSPEGQRFRFAKLMEIGDLGGKRVLDLGCGTGDYYPTLVERFGPIDYTGCDIVPEFIDHAKRKYPGVRFVCRDVLEDPFEARFDYVLLCGLFNNKVPGVSDFIREMTAAAFGFCTKGLGFNFISTHVNFTSPEIFYHDPAEVFDYCVKNLSRKVVVHHHYERCDVCVFVYR